MPKLSTPVDTHVSQPTTFTLPLPSVPELAFANIFDVALIFLNQLQDLQCQVNFAALKYRQLVKLLDHSHLMTARQAATILNVGKNTVLAAIKRGRLIGFKLQGHNAPMVVTEASVKAYKLSRGQARGRPGNRQVKPKLLPPSP